MQRPQGNQNQPKGQWVCPDPEFLSLYPLLAQGMCDQWWDDGKRRDLWTLSVSFTEVAVQISVVDKGLSQSLYTTWDSLSEGLLAIEQVLAAGANSWRRWKPK